MGTVSYKLIPQASIALGVLAALVEDEIPSRYQDLCAGTGLAWPRVGSRGLPWPPVAPSGLPWSPVVSPWSLVSFTLAFGLFSAFRLSLFGCKNLVLAPPFLTSTKFVRGHSPASCIYIYIYLHIYIYLYTHIRAYDPPR